MNGGGEYRAGGTDVEARRRRARVPFDVTDLRDRLGPPDIQRDSDGSVRIAAMTRLAALAQLQDSHPGLAAAAGSLANPHIRAVATVGGSLLQRSRCPYFRTAGVECIRTGVPDCPARRGDHRFGVVEDTDGCLAPHPSTTALAVLAYGGWVSTTTREVVPIDELLDAGQTADDHGLARDEILTGVTLPAPFEGERAAYGRIAGRVLAEWPMVEALVRLDVADGSVRAARVVAGAVAPRPIRLEAMEERLVAGDDVSASMVGVTAGWIALDQTAHKVELLRVLVADLVEAATSGGAGSEQAFGERPIR